MRISTSFILLFLLKSLQFFGLFQHSVHLKKLPFSENKDEKSFNFKFKKSTLLKYWSFFLSFFVILFGLYEKINEFKNILNSNSKYGIYEISRYLYGVYIFSFNILFYRIFYKKSSILKSILKFQIGIIGKNSIDISYLFFIYFIPLILTVIMAETFRYIEINNNGEISGILPIFTEIIIFSIPVYSYHSVFGIFMSLTLSISKVFDIKVNNLENTFHANHYTDKCVNFNIRSFKIILKNHYRL